MKTPSPRPLFLVVSTAVLFATAALGQGPRGGAPGGPAAAAARGGAPAPGGAAGRGGAPTAAGGRGGGAQQSAPIDLTGYWVSVVNEDWEFRMVTPRKGVYDTLPINNEGRRVGDTWDPKRDEANGEQCRAFGAANIMRMPERLHITWENNNTLRMDTDSGSQTRLFRFGAAANAAAGEPSWQGTSNAEWETAGGARGAARAGNLKVVTTNLKPGYLRRNGAPYSKNAVVTEYYDLNKLPNGDMWISVTVKVEDPTYLSRPYITTSDFKKLPDATAWNPTPCTAG